MNPHIVRNLLTLLLAQGAAEKSFASINVKLQWRPVQFCMTHPDAIRITLLHQADPKLEPRAVAYAMPYAGSHVVVFYDRISAFDSGILPYVLGHVFAHEITHLLQGLSRHSDSGLMKAHWTKKDYMAMRVRPLPFAPADVDFIHSGLARHAQYALATSIEPAPSTLRSVH